MIKNFALASTVFVSLLAGSALADTAKPAPKPTQPMPPDTKPADPKPPTPTDAKPAKPAKAPKPVTVKLSDAKGKSVGTATLSADPAGVKITLAVKGLTPGDHAIHVHETAKCDAPDFKSAGGHFNPDHKMHGHDNPQGPHAGDMPNFTVDAKGKSKASVVAPGVTLEEGPHSVFTGGGTALVIHDKADDMKTDPSGAAGDRIACGVIAAKK